MESSPNNEPIPHMQAIQFVREVVATGTSGETDEVLVISLNPHGSGNTLCWRFTGTLSLANFPQCSVYGDDSLQAFMLGLDLLRVELEKLLKFGIDIWWMKQGDCCGLANGRVAGAAGGIECRELQG